MDVWRKFEQFMTPENLCQCGVMEYSVLAQCLGVDIMNEFQVRD